MSDTFATDTHTSPVPARHDSATQYSQWSRILHWGGAVAVLGLLGLGLFFEDMPRGDTKLYWMKLHIALGVLVAPALLFRVIWRLRQHGSPAPLNPPGLARTLTHTVHMALLGAITALVVSGPLAVWSGGRAIELFGLVALPSPMGRLEGLHKAMEGVHEVAVSVLLAALALHVLGALLHGVTQPGHLRGRMFGSRPR